MLKITDNIFNALAGKLEFVSREGSASRTSSRCGIIIPDMDAVEFSNESSSLLHAEKWLTQIDLTCWFMFVIDSAWQDDSPRIRHIGLKPTLNNDIDWTSEIVATAVLNEQEGGIRHCGLVRLKPELLGKALGFIGEHQRTTFLVGDITGGSDPTRLLGVLHQEGAHYVLHSKKSPFIDWVRLVDASSLSDLVFITAFGWPEEHCDLRYLALGEWATLEGLLPPDPLSSTPRG